MAPSKEKTKRTKLAPPDGGYGWVVLLASFMINFIIDGVCLSFGVFYLEFLDYFKESKAKTAWAGSILNGMYCIAGPFTSALCSRFGCRVVCVTGSALAALSFALCTISSSVDVLMLLYGGMAGVGFGLMYFPSIVMVGYYFEKKRAFATGVTVCASGIGALVCAPLFKMLIYEYDWQGAILIMAGMVLNGAIFGALYRPPPTVDVLESSAAMETCEGGHTNRGFTNDLGGSQLFTVETFSQDGETDAHNNNLTLHPACEDMTSPIDICKNRKYVQTKTSLDVRNGCDRNDKSVAVKLVGVKKIEHAKTNKYFATVNGKVNKSAIDVTDVRICSDENTSRAGKNSRYKGLCNNPAFKTVVDISLLRSPTFLVYGMSCFLCMTGFHVPFTYLPDRAKELGIDGEEAAFLISIVGIANTVSRVGTGLLADRACVDSLILNNIALVIGGAAVIAMPFCNSYATLACACSLFGVSIAVFVSLRSILMVELLGLEKLGKSFGLVTMFQGISSFIGAPIAGALYDATGVYDYSFYMAGSTLAAAGLICLPLRRISRWERKSNETHITTSIVSNT